MSSLPGNREHEYSNRHAVFSGTNDSSLNEADPCYSDAEINPQLQISEQDLFLPILNIHKIMKRVIPPSLKVGKDAKVCVQECVSEFIGFITSEAAEICRNATRKTITGEHILMAMHTLGFENYIEPLSIFLMKYRATTNIESSVRDSYALFAASRQTHQPRAKVAIAPHKAITSRSNSLHHINSSPLVFQPPIPFVSNQETIKECPHPIQNTSGRSQSLAFAGGDEDKPVFAEEIFPVDGSQLKPAIGAVATHVPMVFNGHTVLVPLNEQPTSVADGLVSVENGMIKPATRAEATHLMVVSDGQTLLILLDEYLACVNGHFDTASTS